VGRTHGESAGHPEVEDGADGFAPAGGHFPDQELSTADERAGRCAVEHVKALISPEGSRAELERGAPDVVDVLGGQVRASESSTEALDLGKLRHRVLLRWPR